MKIRGRGLGVSALVVAGALTLAACGGSDERRLAAPVPRLEALRAARTRSACETPQDLTPSNCYDLYCANILQGVITGLYTFETEGSSMKTVGDPAAQVGHDRGQRQDLHHRDQPRQQVHQRRGGHGPDLRGHVELHRQRWQRPAAGLRVRFLAAQRRGLRRVAEREEHRRQDVGPEGHQRHHHRDDPGRADRPDAVRELRGRAADPPDAQRGVRGHRGLQQAADRQRPLHDEGAVEHDGRHPRAQPGLRRTRRARPTRSTSGSTPTPTPSGPTCRPTTSTSCHDAAAGGPRHGCDRAGRPVHQRAALSFSYEAYPTQVEAFKNRDVRVALAKAVNWAEINEKLYYGTRTTATAFGPPTVAGGGEDVCGDDCTYDPAAAKALLEKAGGIPGNKVQVDRLGQQREPGGQGRVQLDPGEPGCGVRGEDLRGLRLDARRVRQARRGGRGLHPRPRLGCGQPDAGEHDRAALRDRLRLELHRLQQPGVRQADRRGQPGC